MENIYICTGELNRQNTEQEKFCLIICYQHDLTTGKIKRSHWKKPIGKNTNLVRWLDNKANVQMVMAFLLQNIMYDKIPL